MITPKVLREYNDLTNLDYNHLKAVEELLELAEVLQKKVLKRGLEKEPTNESIVEEIGDVVIRLQVLQEIYGEAAIDARIDYKIDKFTDYYDNQKYLTI